VNLNTGDIIARWVRLEGLVTELYEEATLAGVTHPPVIGFQTDEIRRAYRKRARNPAVYRTLTHMQRLRIRSLSKWVRAKKKPKNYGITVILGLQKAERVGFEPTVPVKVHWFSRPVTHRHNRWPSKQIQNAVRRAYRRAYRNLIP
jgi:hypothetical protein